MYYGCEANLTQKEDFIIFEALKKLCEDVDIDFVIDSESNTFVFDEDELNEMEIDICEIIDRLNIDSKIKDDITVVDEYRMFY